MANPYYINSERRNLSGKKLPMISHGLDSIRAYQWEITFNNLPVDSPAGTQPKPLTLACKQISPIKFTSEDIVVDRVNDKVYYPGKVSFDEVSVVFDNLFATKTGQHLYNWMRTVYDPVTGQFTENLTDKGAGGFKITADIVQLNNQGQPFSHIRLYGLYPKSWSANEFNYSTNDFHTLEVVFRYDFAVARPDANT